MKNRLVLVQWYDAESSDEWMDTNSFLGRDLPLIETLGTLLEENDKGLVIAQNIDASNQKASMVMRIPKGMIEKVFTLVRPKGAKKLTLV